MIVSDKNIFLINRMEGKAFGVCGAYILSRLRHGLKMYRVCYRSNDKVCFVDDRDWIRISAKRLAEDSMMFSERQIKDALKKLKEQRVLLTAHCGDEFDRTNWYAINQDKINLIINDYGNYLEYEPF